MIKFVRFARMFAYRWRMTSRTLLEIRRQLPRRPSRTSSEFLPRRQSEPDMEIRLRKTMDLVGSNPRRSFTHVKATVEYLKPQRPISSQAFGRCGALVQENR